MITSSGTTGTHLDPAQGQARRRDGMVLWKICLFQTFGQEPTEGTEPVRRCDLAELRQRQARTPAHRQHDQRGFTGGDESQIPSPVPLIAVDTDLMFLASKMRAAASRGELDRLEIDPALAARKDEFIAMQLRQPQELDAFFAKITETAARQTGFHDSAPTP